MTAWENKLFLQNILFEGTKEQDIIVCPYGQIIWLHPGITHALGKEWKGSGVLRMKKSKEKIGSAFKQLLYKVRGEGKTVCVCVYIYHRPEQWVYLIKSIRTLFLYNAGHLINNHWVGNQNKSQPILYIFYLWGFKPGRGNLYFPKSSPILRTTSETRPIFPEIVSRL